MSTPEKAGPEDRFIAYLAGLADKENRGALAALRRGLGRPPGTAAEMHPYVMPYLPRGWGWWQECFYIVACLFALHPAARREGNFGDTFHAVCSETGGDSIEARFVALLNAHREDLFGHLRHAVSLAKAKDAPVDWKRLLRDVQHWDDDARWVQRDWARAFWGTGGAAGQDIEQPVAKGEHP